VSLFSSLDEMPGYVTSSVVLYMLAEEMFFSSLCPDCLYGPFIIKSIEGSKAAGL
jgi:hypothetical protein